MILDWKSMPNGQRKRGFYMASREWAMKREAVKKRAKGICEHCRKVPGTQTHHLNYGNLYDEPLEELQWLCGPCHEFLSGKTKRDPAERVVLPLHQPILDKALTARAKRHNIETQVAFLAAIVDLGTHWGSLDKYRVPVYEHGRCLFLVWQIANRHNHDKSPIVVGKEFLVDVQNNQFIYAEGNCLRTVLENWRAKPYVQGEEIDIAKCLRQYCKLTTNKLLDGIRSYVDIAPVQHVGRVFLKLDPVLYHISMEVPNLPDWLPQINGKSLSEIISSSQEHKKRDFA